MGDEWVEVLYSHHVEIQENFADDFSNNWYVIRSQLRLLFEKADYGDIYEFVQFVLRYPDCPKGLYGETSRTLQETKSAYRLIKAPPTLVPLVLPQAAEAIEKALRDTKSGAFSAANGHLLDAAKCLSAGDDSGAIRESIHAVESVAKIIDGDAKSTLGPALKRIEASTGSLHPALRKAFETLYGYTNDKDGIRHASLSPNDKDVGEEEAVFMFVACAGFVSYLISKSLRTGGRRRKAATVRRSPTRLRRLATARSSRKRDRSHAALTFMSLARRAQTRSDRVGHRPMGERAPSGIAMELRDRARMQDAWSAFWRDPASELQCIRRAPDITTALRAHWSAFAASLVPGARVLDLGCGAGAAAGAMAAAKRDLRVTGIDFAIVPAAADPRIDLICDTAMESMPFADASFDAVVSQFGYEYSRTHKTANQLARILAPAARFSFVVHHAASSVVAANRARLNAILAVQRRDMQAAFLAGNAFALDAKLTSLQREHPGDTLVRELSQILPQRAKAGSREREAVWNALGVALSPELTILEALDSCCVAPEELDGWLGPLRQFCAVTSTSILRKPDGTPIAWQIDGMKRPASDA